MEELPGKPWDGQGNTAKVWKGLADILSELRQHPFVKAGSLCVQTLDDTPSVSAVASDKFVCLHPYGPFATSAAYYTAWTEQYLALIADGQLFPQFPVEAYLVYRFLRDHAAELSDSEDQFFLRHVDNKGDHLLVDQDLTITGIIDWQMARVTGYGPGVVASALPSALAGPIEMLGNTINKACRNITMLRHGGSVRDAGLSRDVPRREAFALSLVSADMAALCDGPVSLVSEEDVALGNALREKGLGDRDLSLSSQPGEEKVRRFFWGLALESKWAYALPLANAILQVFGVEQGWDEWKEMALKRYYGDERLKALIYAQ